MGMKEKNNVNFMERQFVNDKPWAHAAGRRWGWFNDKDGQYTMIIDEC